MIHMVAKMGFHSLPLTLDLKHALHDEHATWLVVVEILVIIIWVITSAYYVIAIWGAHLSKCDNQVAPVKHLV